MRWTHIAAGLFLLAFLAIPANGRAYTLKTTSAGATLHWRAPVVELSVHESMVARFGEEGARAALADAIAAWAGAGHGPTLSIGATTHDPPGFERGRATNGVYSISPWPYEKKLLAVTISSYDTRTGELLDADILLNGDEALVAGLRDGHYDLASVLTHEIGHVLGLGESEENPASTMYPRIGKSDARARTPSADDFGGLRAIYEADRPVAQIASLTAHRFRGFWAFASFFTGALVLLVGVRRSHGAASEFALPVRWSARERWDEERLHS
jgi:hypothetical protein